MTKNRLRVTVILLAAALMLGLTPGAPGAGAGPPDGDDEVLYAPDFTLKTLEGKTLTLSSLRGKVVLINFWATWCAPCRYEIPDLSRLQTRYREQGLVVLGVSVDEIETVFLERFKENYKMSYPVLHGPPAEIGRLVQLYGGIYSVPTTFVVDRRGVIVDIFVGARREADFLAAITPLL